MIVWTLELETIHEIRISWPRARFVLHLDRGIRRLPCSGRANSPSPCPCGRILGDSSLQWAQSGMS